MAQVPHISTISAETPGNHLAVDAGPTRICDLTSAWISVNTVEEIFQILMNSFSINVGVVVVPTAPSPHILIREEGVVCCVHWLPWMRVRMVHDMVDCIATAFDSSHIRLANGGRVVELCAGLDEVGTGGGCLFVFFKRGRMGDSQGSCGKKVQSH